MNTKYYLAVDIGASSGRHMLAHLEDGKIVLEEIYRFSNEMIDRKGYKVWNVRRLFQEILSGMKKCAELGKIPYSMGIDTWAVDYVLLDENDRRIGETVAYRDKRTYGMDEEVYKLITEEQLYLRTGIQKQIFNTIYQLMALKKKEPGQLERAETFLMVPDYFNFLLTGQKVQEYTNATTTQLVNPKTRDWDDELIEKLGIKRSIFKEIKVNTVEHQIVKFDEEIGLISANYRKSKLKYQYFDELTIGLNTNSFIEINNLLKKSMNREDYKKCIEQIFKIISVDILFGQYDRWEYNVFFEKSKNHIQLSPMFDNGCIFSEDYGDISIYKSCFGIFSISEKYEDYFTTNVIRKFPKLFLSLEQAINFELSKIFDNLEVEYKIKICKEVKL